MVYRSKRDWSHGLLLFGFLGLGCGLVILLGDWVMLIVYGFLFFVALWFWLTAKYYFSKTKLVARIGPVQTRLQLRGIRKARLIRCFGGGPGLSSDRVELIYGDDGRSWRISPADRETFLRELKERCPWVAIEGQES